MMLVERADLVWHGVSRDRVSTAAGAVPADQSTLARARAPNSVPAMPGRDDVAGVVDDEQVAEALIEDDLRDTRESAHARMAANGCCVPATP
jgi:hypothetical protein